MAIFNSFLYVYRLDSENCPFIDGFTYLKNVIFCSYVKSPEGSFEGLVGLTSEIVVPRTNQSSALQSSILQMVERLGRASPNSSISRRTH